MQRAIKGQEQLAFVGASDAFDALPGNSQSITTMMRLALEAVCPSIRQRASDWLFKSVGAKVVNDGGTNAVKAATANFRR